MGRHVLPAKIVPFLKRLQLEYDAAGDRVKLEIIRASHFLVVEETDFDNWNGGTYGHDVILFLPETIIKAIRLAKQKEIEEEIKSDLNACSSGIDNEYFRFVRIEMIDEQDIQYQQAIGLSGRQVLTPDSVSFWRPNTIRLFISHRDGDKAAVHELAGFLDDYGISSFVAHDQIEPTREWRAEIVRALQTMEVMLVYLTPSFHESVWTNQEVGFALGKDIPIITLKLGATDPRGFIGHEQALRAASDAQETAKRVQRILVDKLGRRERIQAAFVEAFASSPDFAEARERFDRLVAEVPTLTEEQLQTIIFAFAKNDQLSGSIYLNNHYNRLKNYLDRATGRSFMIDGKQIRERKAVAFDEDIPF
ncbi:toll/interleukin-1 receptor domain-containing protein [Salinarimonas sp.]|uniref:toll/interleukin-1 receptor domain-containing protein n=1 Tax=Salinarimonas sp. TaxID=2766526 RepID=UPI0032D8EED7